MMKSVVEKGYIVPDRFLRRTKDKPYFENCALKSIQAFARLMQNPKLSKQNIEEMKCSICEIYDRYKSKLGLWGRIFDCFLTYVLREETVTSQIDNLMRTLIPRKPEKRPKRL